MNTEDEIRLCEGDGRFDYQAGLSEYVQELRDEYGAIRAIWARYDFLPCDSATFARYCLRHIDSYLDGDRRPLNWIEAAREVLTMREDRVEDWLTD